LGANCHAAAAAMTSTPTTPAIISPALLPPVLPAGIAAAAGNGAGRLRAGSDCACAISGAGRLCETGGIGGGSVAGRDGGHCDAWASVRGPAAGGSGGACVRIGAAAAARDASDGSISVVCCGGRAVGICAVGLNEVGCGGRVCCWPGGGICAVGR
jgi:hypothetical protein